LRRLQAIALSALIWALAGGVFGAVFAGLDTSFGELGLGAQRGAALAAALSGALTASFFGAMPVAVLGTLIGVLAGIGYLILAADASTPLPLLAGASVAGAAAGLALPGATVLRSRPLGQAVSGLLAGAAASPLVVLARSTTELAGRPIVSAAIAVVGVGLVYVAISRFIVRRCSNRLSQRLGGPLVTALVAAAVGLALWLVGGTAGMVSEAATRGDIQDLLGQIPHGLIGGALGGAIGGIALEMLGIQLGAYHL